MSINFVSFKSSPQTADSSSSTLSSLVYKRIALVAMGILQGTAFGLITIILTPNIYLIAGMALAGASIGFCIALLISKSIKDVKNVEPLHSGKLPSQLGSQDMGPPDESTGPLGNDEETRSPADESFNRGFSFAGGRLEPLPSENPSTAAVAHPLDKEENSLGFNPDVLAAVFGQTKQGTRILSEEQQAEIAKNESHLVADGTSYSYHDRGTEARLFGDHDLFDTSFEAE